jgi:cell division protein ZapA
MAQLTIQVNGKPYIIGCDDGEEDRVKSLAAALDARVRAADPGGGGLGETRLMLMGALMLADEASTIAERVTSLEAEVAALRADLDATESRAVTILEAAAARIEAMAAR